MSETGSQGRRRRWGGWVAVGLVALVAAGVVSAWRAGVLVPAAGPASGQPGAPATAVVTRQDLSATTPVTATLGYAGSYTVQAQGGGTLTWLPPAGRMIRQGQVLYKTNLTNPVVLLYGQVPAWRALDEGEIGADVSQLNRDLVNLGFADRTDMAAAGWDYYSLATAYGVQRLEENLGVLFPPGSLSLGQVVFEPEPLRVSQVTGSLGGPAAGPVLRATSDRHVVSVALDVSYGSEVRAGDAVSVTLPDGRTTPGVVSFVGTVATTSGSGSESGSSGSGQAQATTIPVQVRLTDPGAAGTLDEAPVTVYITTQSAHDVLAVPVTALVARAPAGYEVEVAGPGNTRRWVPVTVGSVFDDTNGLVQVTGALIPGQRVVVPTS